MTSVACVLCLLFLTIVSECTTDNNGSLDTQSSDSDTNNETNTSDDTLKPFFKDPSIVSRRFEYDGDAVVEKQAYGDIDVEYYDMHYTPYYIEISNDDEEVEDYIYNGTRGIYGGFYRNYYVIYDGVNSFKPQKIAYIHGNIQPAVDNYYWNYQHDRPDDSTLGIYLGYALKLIDDASEIKRNYTINHYFQQENPHKPQRYTSDRQMEKIPPEVIAECQNSRKTLCPENTEPLCLRNLTTICMSKFDVFQTCEVYPEMICVDTLLPCTEKTKLCRNHLETVALPCLTKIVIDLPEHGSLLRVAGTFVKGAEPPEELRTYCATIISDPVLEEIS